jgi:hypothetical protein
MKPENIKNKIRTQTAPKAVDKNAKLIAELVISALQRRLVLPQLEGKRSTVLRAEW